MEELAPGRVSLSPGHRLLATQEVSAWARGAQVTAEGILTSDCTSPTGMKRGFTETLVQSKISEEPKLPGWVPVALHLLLHKGVQPRKEVSETCHCRWIYLLSAPITTTSAIQTDMWQKQVSQPLL